VDRVERLGERRLADRRLDRGRPRGRPEIGERRLDEVGRVEVAQIPDEDQGQLLGPVPAMIEGPDRFRGERAPCFRHADRDALGDPRARELDLPGALEDALAGRIALALLGIDDAGLVLDLLGIEQHAVDEVAQDAEALADRHRVGGGQVDLVDGLAQARERVRVGSERHAVPLEPLDQARPAEALRPVEGHVLEEVRHPALRLLLGEAADVDVESQAAALLGLGVLDPCVPHAVREAPESDAGIDRDVGPLVLPEMHLGRGRRRRCRDLPIRGRRVRAAGGGGEQETEPEAEPKAEPSDGQEGSSPAPQRRLREGDHGPRFEAGQRTEYPVAASSVGEGSAPALLAGAITRVSRTRR
jgi:hypothetical protein